MFEEYNQLKDNCIFCSDVTEYIKYYIQHKQWVASERYGLGRGGKRAGPNESCQGGGRALGLARALGSYEHASDRLVTLSLHDNK